MVFRTDNNRCDYCGSYRMVLFAAHTFPDVYTLVCPD